MILFMIKVDISNVWGRLSLPDLLAVEHEVAAALVSNGVDGGVHFLHEHAHLGVAHFTESHFAALHEILHFLVSGLEFIYLFIELLAKLGYGRIGEAGVILALDLFDFFLESTKLVLAHLDVGLDFSKLLLEGGFRIKTLVELGVKLLNVDGSNLDFGLGGGGQRAQRDEGCRKNGEFHNM